MTDTRLTVLVDSFDGGATAQTDFLRGADAIGIRVLNRCDQAAARAENLVVFSAASRLELVADCVSAANKAHRLAAVLVYRDVDPNWLPYVFDRSGLRTLRNMIVHADPDLPERVLRAWAMSAEHDFISAAAVINDRLIVRSCAFEEYSIAFDAFPALASIPKATRSNFVIEDDGLLLYWPDAQVHLDLDDIRFANDPERQREVRAASIGEYRAVGAALRRLREAAGLRQADIKGLSERQVRRVESGDRLTIDTLDAFAAAMRLEPDHLLDRVSEMLDDLDGTRQDVASDGREIVAPNGEKNDDSRVLRYPTSGAGESRYRTRETLQLAANSLADGNDRRWVLTLDGTGVEGTLQHDYRVDVLYFVIDKVTDSTDRRVQLVLRGHEPGLELVSPSFVPAANARIIVATNRGLVPGDIVDIEMRVADES